MSVEKKFFTPLHLLTKRNYLERMNNDKILCMKRARNYDFDYWDGKRKYGYGGYKYIAGRWESVARQIIEDYSLTNHSKVLDVGCGKGFLLYEMKKILPNLIIKGFDISNFAISNSKTEVRNDLFLHDAKNTYPFKDQEIDLTITLGALHNLDFCDVKKALSEIKRVSKKSYIMVESFRNVEELFNLQCWALTCQIFFSKSDWIELFKQCEINCDYEFIYFK